MVSWEECGVFAHARIDNQVITRDVPHVGGNFKSNLVTITMNPLDCMHLCCGFLYCIICTYTYIVCQCYTIL